MPNEINQFKELGGSNYEIADGEPDIRGWELQSSEGVNIGRVKELLFDEKSRMVRYLVVDIDSDYSGAKADRKVLVPIGLASLHEKNDEVLLPNITPELLASLPEYKKGDLDASTEKEIRNVFAGTAAAGLATAITNSGSNENDNFYDHDHFDEDRLYQSRRKSAEQTIPIIKENINIGKRIIETGSITAHTNIIQEP